MNQNVRANPRFDQQINQQTNRSINQSMGLCVNQLGCARRATPAEATRFWAYHAGFVEFVRDKGHAILDDAFPAATLAI